MAGNGDRTSKQGECSRRANPVATASQEDIITYPAELDTILKIIAGPGSGKTFTLVKRIEYLIRHHDVRPHEIVVLSMSNRAVNALRDALTKTLGEEVSSEITINTFHSFCGGLIDQYSQLYNPEHVNMKLMDDLSWRNFSAFFLGSKIMLEGQKIEGSLTASSLEKMIFDIKSGAITIKRAAEKAKISEAYLHSLMNYMDHNGMMRYHDLLTNALQLINTSVNRNQPIPQLQNYRVVVVDEFQDIYEYLLRIITAVVQYPTTDSHTKMKHLTVAGDPNQSIYEFLGSSPKLLHDLQMQFPSATVIEKRINESFRLTQRILDASTNFLDRLGSSNMIAARGDGFFPIVRTYKSEADETTEVGKEIIRLILELGGLFKFSDFTILTRSNREIEEISRILKHQFDIKCMKLPPSNDWTKSKLHILLDLINVLCNSSGAEFSLLCILSVLDTSNGCKTRVSQLFNNSCNWGTENCKAYLKSCHATILEAYLLHQLRGNNLGSNSHGGKFDINLIYKTPIQKETLNRVDLLLARINDERERLQKETNDLEQIPNNILQSLINVIEDLKLLDYINEPEEGMARKKKLSASENKKSLENFLQTFNRSLRNSYLEYLKTGEPAANKMKFLSFFLRTYNEEIPTGEEQIVKISTIHTAKGLEFPVVFIIGMTKLWGEKSLWDSLLTDGHGVDPSKSRVFYVGCTRARNLLYIGSTKEYSQLSGTIKPYLDHQLPILSQYSTLASDGNITDAYFKSDTYARLRDLAIDLGRALPSEDKLAKGCKIYQRLMNNRTTLNALIPSVKHKFHPNFVNRGYHQVTSSIRNATSEQQQINFRTISFVNFKRVPTSITKILKSLRRHSL